MAGPAGLVVRMRETRVMVRGLNTIDVLKAGREYDLPKEFAAYLILARKADYRPGRLPNFAPKEIPKMPERHEPLKKHPLMILLDD